MGGVFSRFSKAQNLNGVFLNIKVVFFWYMHKSVDKQFPPCSVPQGRVPMAKSLTALPV